MKNLTRSALNTILLDHIPGKNCAPLRREMRDAYGRGGYEALGGVCVQIAFSRGQGEQILRAVRTAERAA